jgi:succinate dehydrogenase / fumarate reductase membrane anchor subunit
MVRADFRAAADDRILVGCSGCYLVSLRSSLIKVSGLGSAKDGTGHWWAQRITAVALIPLGLWFAISVLGMPGADYNAVRSWLAQPLNSILMILLIVSVLHHSQLGIQVVVEDYVHNQSLKVLTLTLSRFLHIALAVAAIYALILISLGSAS